MPSCREQKAEKRERPLPSGVLGLLWPSLPAQKVDAEITDYGAEGVNLVKLPLAVLNAGRAHSVQGVRGERGLAYEWAEKWLVISCNTYWWQVGALIYFPCTM